jgi:hypothetical protein
MKEIRNAYKIFAGKSEGRYDLGGLDIDGIIILKLI